MPSNGLAVVIMTDVFPPGSGGSGWSTFYLGKALQERGHEVTVLRPVHVQKVAGHAVRRTEFSGLQVEELLIPAPPRWLRLGGAGKLIVQRRAERALARRARTLALQRGTAVLHGQHMLSSLAASRAARTARSVGGHVASVATVRDYWPLCPNSTRLFVEPGGQTVECEECEKLGSYLACAGSGPRSVARWLRTLRSSQVLAQCDAVIAVSDYVRGELLKSGRFDGEEVTTIPNLVDLASVTRALNRPWPLQDISPEEPFLLFAGKLDVNKGAQLLPAALARAGAHMPLVLAGTGPLQPALAEEARARGLDYRFHDWLDNDDVVRLMRAARVLVFPSAWQEPLSRVLLEACAAGAAVVAMNTGGSAEIIKHDVSGWLADGEEDFAEGIRRVTLDDELNSVLRAGARKRAASRFAAPVVSGEVERLYRSALEGAA